MAGTVNVSITITATEDEFSASRALGTKTFTTTAANPRLVHARVQSTATPTAIDLEGITSGWGWFMNHHATDSITLHPSGVAALVTLSPSSIACFELAAAPFHTGTGNNPLLEYWILEQ